LGLTAEDPDDRWRCLERLTNPHEVMVEERDRDAVGQYVGLLGIEHAASTPLRVILLFCVCLSV
jgi:hypothetical protein